MENINELIEKIINENSLINSILSGKRKNGDKTFNKVTIKKIIIQNGQKHQFEYFSDKNVEHKNLNNNETISEITKLIQTDFKQIIINTIDADYHILVNKKGEVKINKKARDRLAQMKELAEWDGITPIALPDDLVSEMSKDYEEIFFDITGEKPILEL